MSANKTKAHDSTGGGDLDAELNSFLQEIENEAVEPNQTEASQPFIGPSINPNTDAKASLSICPQRAKPNLIIRELARAEPMKEFHTEKSKEPVPEVEEPSHLEAPVTNSDWQMNQVSVGGLMKAGDKKDDKKRKRMMRHAAGHTWEDETLLDWPEGDFRMFCGDLGNDVSDDTLLLAFRKYPSATKARVVRDKRTRKTKGYGFVSFLDPCDFVKALKEMNGKYCGNRPMKLRKSTWKDREFVRVKKD